LSAGGSHANCRQKQGAQQQQEDPRRAVHFVVQPKSAGAAMQSRKLPRAFRKARLAQRPSAAR
jgi:hypothetical protein